MKLQQLARMAFPFSKVVVKYTTSLAVDILMVLPPSNLLKWPLADSVPISLKGLSVVPKYSSENPTHIWTPDA